MPLDNWIGELMLVPYNFVPKGWAACEGQLLPISSNTALFSLLGTTFGGDGRTNFGLPDLRGRVTSSIGQAPGLANYTLGEQAGFETVTLNSNQMPAHSHNVACETQGAATASPNNAFPSVPNAPLYAAQSDGSQTLAPMLSNFGTGPAPHENRQPYLALQWAIALQGIFPARP
jgi:microcystin-dependent protein